VAITAPCAFVDSIGATIIGLVAGILVCLGVFALEKLKIDDPVGAVPVHFLNGLWGVLSVGLFAYGNPSSDSWNGMKGNVVGLFYGGGTSQLKAQLCEVGAILVFVFGLSLLFFKLLSVLKLLRSKPQDEIMGLDMPEMGALGYNNVDLRMHSGRVMPQTPFMGNGKKS
jgi:Amt family ammonium transporter